MIDTHWCHEQFCLLFFFHLYDSLGFLHEASMQMVNVEIGLLLFAMVDFLVECEYGINISSQLDGLNAIG